MTTKSDALITAGIAVQSSTRADQLIFTLPIPVDRSLIDSGNFEIWATQSGWPGGTTAQAAAYMGNFIDTYINQAIAQSIIQTDNAANALAIQATIASQVN